MAKNINEKTFELNITNELLTLSKSFIWYLDYSPFGWWLPRSVWFQFFNQASLFAVGLTQDEESNPQTGGYDVSINFTPANGIDGRLMFLQFKAGEKVNYSNNNKSNFYRATALKANRTAEHISFKFNDAANGTQHSTLRNLANKPEIQSDSVMYVFPRITEKTDFESKIGRLIFNSSFVPVLEIDNQAAAQNPKLEIIDGESHNYRTSYDGSISEVNFFFFFFEYSNTPFVGLLEELICIQIERLMKLVFKLENNIVPYYIDALSLTISEFLNEIKLDYNHEIFRSGISKYVDSIKGNLERGEGIPNAPSKYTTIVPKEGLRLNFDKKVDFSTTSYQVF
jgi:hypothetical protein